MALQSVGRIDGYDQDGKARRVIVYRRDDSLLFALAARHHIASTTVDFVAEASQAFGLSDSKFHRDGSS
jgi:hypothetical protein